MKNIYRNLAGIALILFSAAALTACAPEVGSEAWCKNMKEKPKGEWTANEVSDFARHCVMK